MTFDLNTGEEKSDEIKSRKRKISDLSNTTQDSNCNSITNDADLAIENSSVQASINGEVHKTRKTDSTSNYFPENHDDFTNQINCPESNGIDCLAKVAEPFITTAADNGVSSKYPETVKTENLTDTCTIEPLILPLNDESGKTKVTMKIDENETKNIVLWNLTQRLEFEQNLQTEIKSRLSITQLDIQVINWDFADATNNFLKAVAELKSLEKLAFSARLLHYKSKAEDRTADRTTLFSKIVFDKETTYAYNNSSNLGVVVQNCIRLKSLIITDDSFPTDRIIPEYFLILISKFAKLEVLILKNFPTLGRGVSLPYIFKRCVKLKHVSIENLGNLEEGIKIYSLEESIPYLNICEELNLSLKIDLSNTLITNICKCTKLESLSLEQMKIKFDANQFQKSISQLPNLRKLSLSIAESERFFRSFHSAMSELKTKRKEFVYFLKKKP